MVSLDKLEFSFNERRRGIQSKGNACFIKTIIHYRSARYCFSNTQLLDQVVYLNGAVRHHIKSLEAELSHYRNMVDEMVRLRTEKLERRLSILESCNSSLTNNYHKMHQMYLDLLLKTQSNNEGMNQCLLESDMASVIQTKHTGKKQKKVSAV